MKINSDLSAIVTGGASGLGEAVVRSLTAQGVKVGIFDFDEQRGQQVSQDVNACFAKVDVSDIDSVKAGFEKVRTVNGTERVIVNCAGIAPGQKTVLKTGAHDPELYVKTIAVNLVGSFYCSSQSATAMCKEQPLGDDGERGVIINTASVAAYEGQVGQVAYSSSKGGIVGMTLPMARDLARDGVRVVAIAPGLFMTPMMSGFSDEVKDSLAAKAQYPKRLGNPEDFANLVSHIIENTMINGEVIRLDGAVRLEPR